jgi:hypothetical protein
MRIRKFLTATLIATCYGCKSDVVVNGDVFVVTRGGDNIKLALVTVSAIAEDDLRREAMARATKAKSLMTPGSPLDSIRQKGVVATALLASLKDVAGSPENLEKWKTLYLYPAFPGVGDGSRWNS